MTTAAERPRKPKKCKACREPFAPARPLQSVCSPACALTLISRDAQRENSRRAREERKALREAKAKAKTRSDWQKEAQQAVNAYVRARDTAAGLPCISCGRFHQGQNHAGHYRSVGSAPHLRFDADRNIALQCQPCNVHLHGNLVLFRKNLIQRIGLETVEELEADQSTKKYTVDDLRQIRDEYRLKAKQIKENKGSTT